MVIEMARGHEGSTLVDKLEHRLAAADDGNLGPLPLGGVVNHHVHSKVVEV